MTTRTTRTTPRSAEEAVRRENVQLSGEIERLKGALAEKGVTLDGARRQLLECGERIDGMSRRLTEAAAERDRQRQKADAAEAAEKLATRELHAAQMENARLRGYIERVTEDDAAREGGEEVQRTEINPRRPRHLMRSPGLVHQGSDFAAGAPFPPRPSPDWTRI